MTDTLATYIVDKFYRRQAPQQSRSHDRNGGMSMETATDQASPRIEHRQCRPRSPRVHASGLPAPAWHPQRVRDRRLSLHRNAEQPTEPRSVTAQSRSATAGGSPWSTPPRLAATSSCYVITDSGSTRSSRSPRPPNAPSAGCFGNRRHHLIESGRKPLNGCWPFSSPPNTWRPEARWTPQRPTPGSRPCSTRGIRSRSWLAPWARPQSACVAHLAAARSQPTPPHQSVICTPASSEMLARGFRATAVPLGGIPRDQVDRSSDLRANSKPAAGRIPSQSVGNGNQPISDQGD